MIVRSNLAHRNGGTKPPPGGRKKSLARGLSIPIPRREDGIAFDGARSAADPGAGIFGAFLAVAQAPVDGIVHAARTFPAIA